jgi:4'-phosphopantetheinyl transferase
MISDFSDQDARRVEVWPVRIEPADAVSHAGRSLLSPEEVGRADRFSYAHLRVFYEVSHGVLRMLLSRYLSLAPREIEFTFGYAGKPALCGDSRLRFNMSHSGGLAVYAFTLDCEIGVDIEEVREMTDIEAIAEHQFCRAEASELLGVSGARERREAFFRCWTRKESYIKTIGDGLSVPLDQFQVTFLADTPARLVHIGNDATAASAWTLHHLEPAPGYVGALAYRGEARRVTLHPPRLAQEILTPQ